MECNVGRSIMEPRDYALGTSCEPLGSRPCRNQACVGSLLLAKDMRKEVSWGTFGNRRRAHTHCGSPRKPPCKTCCRRALYARRPVLRSQKHCSVPRWEGDSMSVAVVQRLARLCKDHQERVASRSICVTPQTALPA